MTIKEFSKQMDLLFSGLRHQYEDKQKKELLLGAWHKLKDIDIKHLESTVDYFIYDKDEEWLPTIGVIVRDVKARAKRESMLHVAKKETNVVDLAKAKEAKRRFLEEMRKSRGNK